MPHLPLARLATLSILAAITAACAPKAPSTPSAATNPPTGEWPAYGSDKAGTKYSALDQINRDTIANLRIAWTRSSMPEELVPDFPNTAGSRNLQNTPIMVNGLLYMSSVVGAVVALDPTTGKTVWYDHLPPRADGNGLTRGGSTRSLAYWTDGSDARIVTNVGSSLVALNAKTGERYKDFGDGGQVDLTQGFERPVQGWRWTSGPVVVRDVIVVAGVPAPATDILSEAQLAPKVMPPDDVRGYDVRTGKLLWTFHVVPRAGEPGNDTWLEDSWTYSGNSGSWTLLGADDELGYVYLPTEEATGDYYGGTRPGTNLYAESVVALDAKTGKHVWHFQTVHHGIFDYDLPAPPVLADITVNGRKIKALAQVSKQAFVYVLNRETGEPVWPIEERPAPKGNVPGEWYSPTQPFPTKPPAFDQQGVADSDIIDYTPELKAEAMEILKGYAYGPLYTPPVLLGNPDTPKGTLLVPGTNGGADWGGAALDPETNILYVPSAHMPTVIALGPSENPDSTLPYVKHRVPWPFGPRGLPDPFKPPYARLVAIDLNEGTIRWSVANGDGLRNHPAFAGLNLPPLGTPGRMAALVTKSFVFLGEGSDTGVGLPPGGGYGGKMFRAFDKATGKIAWEMELPAGVSNAPMTYSVNGKQYIVVGVSGMDHPGELIALTLP